MSATERMRQTVRAAEIKWGTELQKKMVIGECAELITSMVDYDRGRDGLHDLCDEVADVFIMLDFMRLYLGDENVDAAIERKLERLEERL